MAIPNDTYFIVTPGSEFVSKAYGNLNGTDLFFYITDTGSLRVVNMNSGGGTASPGIISFSLAQSVKWVGVLSMPGMVHVYYATDAGQMNHISYSQFGGPFRIDSVPIASAVTFSVTTAPNTSLSPQVVYLLVVDDGVRHTLYSSLDPAFGATIGTVTTYNNSIGQIYYVTRPSIAVHPLDTDRVTLHVQRIKIQDATSNVGFFVVRIPGVA